MLNVDFKECKTRNPTTGEAKLHEKEHEVNTCSLIA